LNIPYPTAKKSCTSSEFQLIGFARAANLGKIPTATLKAKIKRTREFLDKWRDLTIGQARQKGHTPERTQRKVAWFEEALLRFEGELKKRETKAAQAAKKRTGAKASRPSPKPPMPRPSKKRFLASDKSMEAAAKARAARIAKSGILRQRGHHLASGKRNQAKRNRR